MITPKDVPLWLMSKGIGCIVLRSQSPGPWYYTPHSIVVGGKTSKTMPKRICKTCREAMSKITV